MEEVFDSEEIGDVPEGFRALCARKNEYDASSMIGLTQPHDTAVKYFNYGAEHGNARAQFCLGFYYLKGYGVQQSNAKATYWFEQALQQNLETVEKYFMFIFFSQNHTLSEEDENLRLVDVSRFVLEQGTHMKAAGVLPAIAENLIAAHQKKLAAYYSLDVVPFDPNSVGDYLRDLELFNVEIACSYLERLMVEESFKAHFEVSMKIATHLFSRGALSDETVNKLTTTLRNVPADNLYYADAQWILSHLCLLPQKKEVLAKYHFNNYAAGIYFPGFAPVLDELSLARCEAEIAAEQAYVVAERNLSEAEFKIWLETKFKTLEPRELNLSPSETDLFHEICFRLAKENPKIIDYYLDRIPCDHKRFREAQRMLQQCPAHKQTGRHLTTFYPAVRNVDDQPQKYNAVTVATLVENTKNMNNSRRG